LTEDDWKMMAAAFQDFEHREREFITVPLMPLNLVLPDGGRTRLADALSKRDDQVLARWPHLGKYARRTLLIIK
jgi:hypothetical protein